MLKAFMKLFGKAYLDRSIAAEISPVQIICGNCMGKDNAIPIKTQLRNKSCSACGGKSYILASTLAVNMRVHQALQNPEAVFPFYQTSIPRDEIILALEAIEQDTRRQL